jgi:hypothetical protein
MGDGRRLSWTVTARLTGTIVCEKVDDTFTPISLEHKLATLLAKQEELRSIFAVNGLMFQVQGWDGTAPVQFPAIVESIDFSEGIWTDRTDYTIVLRGPDFEDEKSADDTNCESASETWAFEEGDLPRTWKATHSVSAKGKLVYDGTGNISLLPWQHAKNFVTSKLGLDWNTATDPDWSPLSGNDLAALSASAPRSTNQWNRTIVENVDETDGSYSVTETWVLNEQSYVEEFTISLRRVEEPKVTTQVSITGSVRGLAKNVGDFEGRYAAALAQWPTVKALLLVRCQDQVNTVGGGTLGAHPTAMSVDHNPYEGSISYNFEFSDRVIVNDTIETYTLSQSTSLEDYKTVVRIDGSITGVVYLDDGPSTTIKFTRAELQWEVVKNLLFARVVSESGVSNLKAFPVSAQFSFDQTNGVVNYTYEFDDRDPQNVRNEFTVTSRTSREDGRTTVTVEGTVTGLRTANASDPFGQGSMVERYNNAVAYYNGIAGNLLGVAATYVNLDCINPTPYSTSAGYNPLAGTVAYSAEFTSQIAPVIPGALTESVSITDDAGTPVFAVIPVPGLEDGPIFQDIKTKKEKRRSINVEVVMPPPKYGCGVVSYDTPSFDVSQYTPQNTASIFLEQDQVTWSPQSARYTRTVVWVYK